MLNSILTKAEQIARSKIGYREGPKNNENMFGKWFGMDQVAWCAIFLSWLSDQSGLTYLGKPWRFASTVAAQAHANRAGRWVTMPQVGTIAMMKHSSTTGHVGYVIAILARAGQVIVVTIEGNTNDQGAREGNGVWIRERSVSSWDGYIVLDQTNLVDLPVEDDEMQIHLYRIRDETKPTQQHPVSGAGIWVSDGLTTNIMSEAQFVHGKNMDWYDETKVELVPETFHNALLETSRLGNIGGPSVIAILESIKKALEAPDTDGGPGLLTVETIDSIAKAVLDAEHKRMEK